MAVFVVDTFTRASNANLQSHTPDVGGTWAVGPGPNRGTATVDATLDRVYADNNSGLFDLYRNTATPASAEYDVQADIVQLSAAANRYAMVAGRISSSAETLYEAGWDVAASNSWSLAKGVAGTYTTLATSAFTPVTSTVYTIRLVLRNATKKLFVNGAEILSSPDNAVSAAGFAGLDLHIATSTTGWHMDNFRANDPVAPPPRRAAQRVITRARRF